MNSVLALPRWFRQRGVESRRQQQLDRILAESPALRSLADDQIHKASLALRYRMRSGEPAESLMPQAFALVREAGRRALGMEHFPVQLLAGIALWDRCVTVMQTGEGKTLTATLPLYLAALSGSGSHLATANDYLATRDSQWMRPLYSLLGMTVGAITTGSDPAERAAVYRRDITYTTARELGFDFLRDRLRQRASNLGGAPGVESLEPLQPKLNFALVDEADSILIDEARTPLVLNLVASAELNRRADMVRWAASAVSQFHLDEHFQVEHQPPQVRLNRSGRDLARRLAGGGRLQGLTSIDLQKQLELALLVEQFYVRDRHYVVRDGQVVIVDEFSGRLAEGRQWRSGLHQAIEAREGLAISPESGEAARITIQALFGRYRHLAGMTGTLANSAAELRELYRLQAAEIPTNRPPRRESWPTLVCGTAAAKWLAIAREVAEVHATGRPVLIGTRSIDKSELLSGLLQTQHIEHAILNARDLTREAEIVAAAGRHGQVTVATNLAGRGTDIRLDEAAYQAGGLHVILSELHDSARIDRQLIGRSGRQGDPGSYRFVLSLEDEILSQGLSQREVARLQRYAAESPVRLSKLEPRFRLAQRRIEQRHAQSRRLLLLHQRQRQEVFSELGLDPCLD
ncbi:MAG: preprotein translocase subunit SecA [Planctomycetota bacterium]|jgi:preprotein translocase subunit SecA|nr:preprotein translocase subunit SecA [Blastopirellula sp.]